MAHLVVRQSHEKAIEICAHFLLAIECAGERVRENGEFGSLTFFFDPLRVVPQATDLACAVGRGIGEVA